MSLLTSYINDFNKAKILVIGDIMLDIFMYGKVERVSPEAPVPVLKFYKEKKMLGGAGNVVANMSSLGGHVNFIGVIGDDENGDTVSALLKNVNTHFHLLRLKNYPTIVKTRFIAANSHLLRVDKEEKLPIVTELLPRFRKILIQAIKDVDVVVLSDYNKGLLTPETTQMIIKICNDFNKIVIADPKGTDYSKYAGATLVKPNLKEFSEATGIKYNPADKDFPDKARVGADILFSKFKIQNLLVTLSEYGMIYIPSNNTEEVMQIPTRAKEVFDVSGAGDTALATMGLSLGVGIPLKDAIKLANIASGIAVGKLGTATVLQSELKDALSERAGSGEWQQKQKIITLSQAKGIVEKLKQQGKVIGFTNGCFDCCHLGHLDSFMQTKKYCDVLIVAMNSDESVKRHKGTTRPLQDEKTRALLLASLEMVDYVIVFEEDSPMHIVETLKPDLVAKEGYELDEWPEGRLAISYGGKAVTLKRLGDYSTSNLVNKIRK